MTFPLSDLILLGQRHQSPRLRTFELPSATGRNARSKKKTFSGRASSQCFSTSMIYLKRSSNFLGIEIFGGSELQESMTIEVSNSCLGGLFSKYVSFRYLLCII